MSKKCRRSSAAVHLLQHQESEIGSSPSMSGLCQASRDEYSYRALFTSLIAIFLTGCTVVEVSESNGSVRIERLVGIASISIQPDAEAVVARMRSFGLASTPFGFTAGYSAHQFATLGEDCRVVFWVENMQQFTELENVTTGLTDVCTINPNQGENQ